jgi:hypothetical protein
MARKIQQRPFLGRFVIPALMLRFQTLDDTQDSRHLMILSDRHTKQAHTKLAGFVSLKFDAPENYPDKSHKTSNSSIIAIFWPSQP